MFAWLKRLREKRKAKDTEAVRIKEQIIKRVAECHQAAALGDAEATLTLTALDKTITEQSIRLTGGGK